MFPTTLAATYQIAHQASRGKEALQKVDEVSLRKKDTATEDDNGRSSTNGFVEGVKACGWKYESTDIWNVRKTEND